MATPWRRLSTVGWSIVATVFITLLIAFGTLRPAQRVLAPVFAPVGRFARAIVDRISTSRAETKDRRVLQTENEDLRQQLLQLQLDRASLNQQLTELKLTRDEAAFLAKRSLAGISARVIGRSEVSAQVLLVDAGTHDGVTVGAPVVARGGVFVGTVTDASDSTCNVRLLTADGTNVGVRVEHQDGPSGILVGEQGTGMRLTFVPKSATIAERQTVITSDLNPHIPSGLLIGTLTSISSPVSDLFQSATVVPTVPYDQLTVVTIVKRS